MLKLNPTLESELLSQALVELPIDMPSDLPADNLPPEPPSDNLPPELLQLIFSNLPPHSLKYDSPLVYLTSDDMACLLPACRSSRPLKELFFRLVSLVCRRWREVVSAAHLWSWVTLTALPGNLHEIPAALVLPRLVLAVQLNDIFY